MNILLFGTSNVGKTTTGELVAERLGYDFFDIDDEVVKHCSMTIEEFVGTVRPYERDRIRGEIIGRLLAMDGDKVIAVAPMYYARWFSRYMKRKDVITIELQDEPENIFSRLIFTNENGDVYEDSVQYREKHKAYYLEQIKKDVAYYKPSFSGIGNKFQMKNDPPEVVADRLIEQYDLSKNDNEC